MDTEVKSGNRKGTGNYPIDFKRRLALAACEPGISVCKLAQEHQINTNILFKWRRDSRAGLFDGWAHAPATLLPAAGHIAGSPRHKPLTTVVPVRIEFLIPSATPMTILNSASAFGALRPPVMLDDKLLEYVPGAVYVCDLDGVVVRYNKRAGELWGRYPEPGDPKELWCGSHKLYRETGELMPHDKTPMVDSLRNGNSYRNVEVQVEQPSGNMVWIMVNIDPLRNDDGNIVGVINCFQDITDRKLANERQKSLVNELNHRVKNTLATVQAIASHTFRAGVGNDAPKWFEARIHALSHAHEILARETWNGADLAELVKKIGAPWREDDGNRSVLTGPDVHVEPKLALSLAIAIHELFTNAAKYGALSSSAGRVDLTWSLNGSNGARSVEIHWQESNGPTVQPPEARGFGSRVIERTLVREHDAIVELTFLPPGVQCKIVLPLP